MYAQTKMSDVMPRMLAAIAAGSILLGAPIAKAQTVTKTDEEITTLDPFTVNSEQDVGYGAKFSAGASRINMENLSVSATVITLNEKFLSDLKPVELFDALKYVSGVAGNGNTLNSSQVTLRGYQTNIEYRDGIRETVGSIDGGGQFDPFSTARMEIIKGPAGVLFGATTVGGIFNRVSKRPLNRQETSVRLTGGGDDFKRLDIDSTGPVGRSESLKYRAGLVWQDAETFLGGVYDRFGVFGVVQWAPSSSTTVSTRYEYQHNTAPVSWSSWFMNRLGQVSSFLDREVTPNEPWERNDFEKHMLEVNTTTQLNAHLATRFVARYDFSDEWMEAIIKNAVQFYDRNNVYLGREIPSGGLPTVSFDNPSRFGSIRMTRDRRYDFGGTSSGSVNFDVTGDYVFGPTTHKAFLYSGLETVDFEYNRITYTYSVFDFLNPVNEPNKGTRSTNPRQNFAETRTNRAFNAGFQDNIGILDDRVVFAAGGRYDWAENTTVDPIVNANVRRSGQDWTFKYGVVGKVRPGIALFAQHSETFEPLGGLDHLGQPFKNLEGVNDEVGVKLELFKGGLVSTFSVFDARLKNQVLSGDTLPDGRREQIQIGENNTDGWEVDFAWQVSPSLAFLGGYGDLTSVNERKIRIRHVPQGPNYKVFGKYSFLTGPIKGFEVGLGYVYVNDRAGDNNDSFNIPDFSTWDMVLNYRWGMVDLSLVVRNLTDETYINTGGSERRAQVGEFRTIRFSTAYRF